MSKRIAEPPWMCSGCGYVMDGASNRDPTSKRQHPEDGDVASCMNCGGLHMRHGDKWVWMTADEWKALTPGQRKTIAIAEFARRMAIREDLAAKQGGKA